MKFSKVMRGVVLALVACVLAVSLSACGDNGEQEIRDAIDAMMAVFQNPVEHDAASHLDDATLARLEEYGVDGNEYLSHCFGNLSYEVTGVSVNGDVATVQMSVTNASLADALSAAGQDFDEYADTDEARALYQSDGENALFAKLFEFLYARLDAEDVELRTSNVQITLVKDEEGVWVVNTDNPDFYTALYGGSEL